VQRRCSLGFTQHASRQLVNILSHTKSFLVFKAVSASFCQCPCPSASPMFVTTLKVLAYLDFASSARCNELRGHPGVSSSEANQVRPSLFFMTNNKQQTMQTRSQHRNIDVQTSSKESSTMPSHTLHLDLPIAGGY
jgi:hypothetical protein